jgi:hypothetical protein
MTDRGDYVDLPGMTLITMARADLDLKVALITQVWPTPSGRSWPARFQARTTP